MEEKKVEDKDQFYQQLEIAYYTSSKNDIMIFPGNFKVKVEQEEEYQERATYVIKQEWRKFNRLLEIWLSALLVYHVKNTQRPIDITTIGHQLA